MQVLSQVVLRMASASSSAAGVPHLLQLAAGAAEPAARGQLQAAVLDLLLPASAGPPSAELLLRNLAAAAQQCSGQQLEQLRQAVQQAVVGSVGGSCGATAAVVRSAVRTCYQQLYSLCSNQQGDASRAAPPTESKDGSTTADAQTEALRCAATALFVLGPLSSPPQADASANLAEARLLLAGLQHASQAGVSKHSCAVSRLQACTALAWQQLGPVCLPVDGSGSQPSEDPCEAASAALALAHATMPALQALLLDPCCNPSLRQAALRALFALPPAAQAPLRLLRSLTTAAVAEGEADGAAGAEEAARTAQLQLPPEGDVGLQLPGADGCPKPRGGGTATSAIASQSAGGTSRLHAAIGTSTRQQQVQESALVALLDLLGGLASTYEQQKAAFLQQLVAGAAQREREQAQHAQHAAGQTSHFGRPLRPASEWWVGTGQPAGGAIEQAGAAHEGDAAAADDYMRAEHLAAEHEVAAQRFLESLLEAADTAPACYLPLLERLAGKPAGEGEEAEEERAVSLPAAVQVRGR